MGANIFFIAGLLSEYTVQVVLASSMMLGAATGALGAFILLRQQSLLGDAIAHAALPGTILAFWGTALADHWVLMFGSLCSSACGIQFMQFLLRHTRLKKDAILGIMLSFFFGTGLVLLTVVQKKELAQQALLHKYLFGGIATMLYRDLMVISGIATVVCIGMFFLCTRFSLITFDRSYAWVSGCNVRLYDRLFYALLVLVIATGLPLVGVIFMSTLLIAPTAAARQWTRSIKPLLLCAAVLGAFFSAGGVLMSTVIGSGTPTGPCIIIVASVSVFVSLLIAPERGLLVSWHKRVRSL